MFSERIENTVEEGEIARYEQFHLFPLCFQKTCTADTLIPGLVWQRVKRLCMQAIRGSKQQSSRFSSKITANGQN